MAGLLPCPARAGCPPDLPPGGLLDGVAVLAAEQAAVRAGAGLLEVGARFRTSWNRLAFNVKTAHLPTCYFTDV